MKQNKSVCMFVWNHFTNDARVLRECTALSEVGYSVDLICIHDRKQKELPRFEQRNERFTVTRVNNVFPLYPFVSKVRSIARRRKWLSFPLFTAMMLFSLYLFPIVTTALVAIFLLLMQRKMRVAVTRSWIFLQMVGKGLNRKYDVYHSNDLNTLSQGVICAKLLRNKPLIYDSHEVQTSRTGYDSPWYGRMEQFLLRFCNVMIQENHTRAAFIEQLYGFYPKVLHNYPIPTVGTETDDVDLHEELNISKEEPILLYQGGIQTGRGLDKIVDAIPFIKRGVVVFIGDGRIKEALQNKVAEKKLGNRVRFIPKVPLAKLPSYTRNGYLGFQVLNNVCFNHFSASSNKLFEYMMSGVPVVACDFPEIKRVVEGEEVGICVDSHNPEAIAEGVNALLDQPELREKLAENCLRARMTYSWEKEKQHLLDIYEEVQLGETFITKEA